MTVGGNQPRMHTDGHGQGRERVRESRDGRDEQLAGVRLVLRVRDSRATPYALKFLPREIGGKVKTAGEVRLNGGRPGQMAFQTTSNHQNRGCRVVADERKFPRRGNVGTLAAYFELSGECRFISPAPSPPGKQLSQKSHECLVPRKPAEGTGKAIAGVQFG